MLACAIALAAATSASARHEALPRGGKVIARVSIPEGYGGLTVGEGAVWVINDLLSTLTRVNPQGNRVAARIKVELAQPCPPYVCGEPAVGNGAVWVPRVSDNAVSRIDLASNAVTATIPVGRQPIATAVTPGAVWVLNGGGPTVSRIDPSTNRVVATIRVGPTRARADRGSVTAGAGSVWVGVPGLRSVVRLDPATNKVTATIRLSDAPCGFLVASTRAVWASGAACSGTITRIDPRTNRQTGTVTGALAPIGLARRIRLGLGRRARPQDDRPYRSAHGSHRRPAAGRWVPGPARGGLRIGLGS